MNAVRDHLKLKLDEEDEFPAKLKDIVEAAPGNDFVWSCCYCVPALKNTTLRGWRFGINQQQFLPGSDKFKANLPGLGVQCLVAGVRGEWLGLAQRGQAPASRRGG
jgi:hypothetical protein